MDQEPGHSFAGTSASGSQKAATQVLGGVWSPLRGPGEGPTSELM